MKTFSSRVKKKIAVWNDRDPSGWWLKVIGERVSAIKKRFRVIFYSISWFLLALTPGDSLWARFARVYQNMCTVYVHAGLWEQWTHNISHNENEPFYEVPCFHWSFSTVSFVERAYELFYFLLWLTLIFGGCVDRVIRLWMRSREAW